MSKRLSKIIFLAATFVLVFLLFQIKIERTTYSQESESNKIFGEIVLDNTLVQQISVPVNIKIDNVRVKLATFGRKNTNNNLVELYVNNEKRFTTKFSSEIIIDDAYNRLFDKNMDLNVVAGDTVTLVLTSEDGSVGNAITAWGDDKYPKGMLYVRDQNGNETKMEGAMNLRFSYDATLIEWLGGKYQNHPMVIIIFIGMVVIGATAFVKLCMELILHMFVIKPNK